jgi:poly(A) polymerase
VSGSWIVGGALRDELLGRDVTDIDIAVEEDPEGAARELAAELRGPVFQLSEAFGAWRVVDRRGGRVYDFARLQGDTIEEDLAKRDFTVNAMARPLPGGGPTAAPGELIDPLGGQADLEARMLRVLGPAAYENDPLRPLRLVRFAAELGFAPDPETERLTTEAAPRVSDASGERVFAELRRLLIASGAVAGLALADRLGLVRAVLPELADLHDVEQSHFHHLDVYGHTLEVFERLMALESEASGELREVLDEPLADELTRGQALCLGALLHDIGKPATHHVREDGRVTFMGHDRLGQEMVHTICRRLRTSERLCRFLEAVTRHHLVLGFLVHERPLDRRAVYRYLERTSPVEVEVTLLSVADRLATRGKNAERAIDAHLELAEELMPAALEWRRRGPPPVPVRGDELAEELGIDPGPELGRLLDQLAEAAYAGEATDRQQAIDLARTLRHNPGR